MTAIGRKRRSARLSSFIRTKVDGNDEPFSLMETLEPRMLLSGSAIEGAIDLGEVRDNSLTANGQISRKVGKVSYLFEVTTDGEYVIGVAPESGRINIAIADSNGRILKRSFARGSGRFVTGLLDAGQYELRLLRRGRGLTDYQIMIAGQDDTPLTFEEVPVPDNATEQPEPETPATASTATIQLEKPIFDLIRFNGMPDIQKQYGLSPIVKLGVASLWEKGDDIDQVNFEQIRRRVKSMDPDIPVVIDIEHWPTDGARDEIIRSIDKLVSVARAVREANPDLKFGFYRMLPTRNYFGSIRYDRGDAAYERWRDKNRLLKRLAREVDYIFPSVYAFQPDYREDGSPDSSIYSKYREYVIENIQEAKRYFGKPIYAFIAPYYPPNDKYFADQPISGEFWRRILRTVGGKADGMVIWTSWSGRTRGWDAGRDWWQETVEYAESH